MAALYRLPNELLFQVIGPLDRPTLLKLCLVSKRMAAIAEDLLYSAIVIRRTREHYGRPIRNLALTLIDRPDVAQKIRTLDLELENERFSLRKGAHDRSFFGIRYIRMTWGRQAANMAREGHEGVFAAVLLAHAPNVQDLRISDNGLGNLDLEVFKNILHRPKKKRHMRDSQCSSLAKLTRVRIGAGIPWSWFERANLDEVVIRAPDWELPETGALPNSELPTLTYQWIHKNYAMECLESTLRTCPKLTTLNLEEVAMHPFRLSHRPNINSWKVLVTLLKPVAKSLETLSISLAILPDYTWLSRAERLGPDGNLTAFEKLKTLHIPDQAFARLDTSVGLHDVLPSGIETLIITTPTMDIFPLLVGMSEQRKILPKLKTVELHARPYGGAPAAALTSSPAYTHLQRHGGDFSLAVEPNEAEHAEYRLTQKVWNKEKRYGRVFENIVNP